MEVEDTHHQVTTASMAPSYKRKYRQVTSRTRGGTRIYEILRDEEQTVETIISYDKKIFFPGGNNDISVIRQKWKSNFPHLLGKPLQKSLVVMENQVKVDNIQNSSCS